MNWKQEAIERLEQYTAKQQSLTLIPEEIKRLESVAARLRGVQMGGVSVKRTDTRREDGMLNNIVQREELGWALEQAQKWVDQVDTGLSVLDSEQKMILDRFYIHSEKGAADSLAGDLAMDVKTVYRRKDAALKRFTIALWGCVES